MFDLDTLKFDEKGLIPAIIVDDETKQVLTLAYMNRESLEISLEKKLTCFFSRSRQELWLKGDTSGNYQHIVSVTADCDKATSPWDCAAMAPSRPSVTIPPDSAACGPGPA